MAGSSLLALIDDIATLLDDVAVLSKVAVKRTAGVLGDDLALNAEQVAGVSVDRELPVVWAVAKGSAVNKAILVPAALLLTFFLPVAIMPLLMLGGAFLCFEGFEKIAHKFLVDPKTDADHEAELAHAAAHAEVDLVALEADKIKGAIRTDFILSAEIIVISLGAIKERGVEDLVTIGASLVSIAVLMTVGVYGLVGLVVKLDDMGLALSKRSGLERALGRALVLGAPKLMRFLSVAGTAAMFLVGGGILAHAIPGLEAALLGLEGTLGVILGTIASMLANALVGIIAGGVIVGALTLARKARGASH